MIHLLRPGTTAALAFAAVAAGTSGPRASESIVFEPVQGTTVKKSIVVKHDLLIQRIQFQGKGPKGRDIERTIPARGGVASVQSTEFVDEYVSVEGRRPLVLRRSFPSLGAEASMLMEVPETSTTEAKLSSPLEGASVVFTWVEDEGEYGRYYDAREEREKFLAELSPTVDLAFLLPEGDVSPGDAWEVPIDATAALFAAGGNLQLASTGEEGTNEIFGRMLRAGVGANLSEAYGGESRGRVRVEFKEVVDGAAVLDIELELGLSRDKESYLSENVLQREKEASVEFSGGRLVLRIEGNGTLHWDLGLKRARSFTLAGKESATISIYGVDNAGEELVQKLVLEGRISVEAEFGPGVAEPAPTKHAPK